MKKTLFFFIAVLLFVTGAGAQNWDEIVSSDKYYYGEGFSDTYDKAKNMALQNLTGMIATHVSNDFTYLIDEANTNGDIDHKSQVLNCLKTYSQATLRNVKEWVVSDPPECKVRCYIECAEMERVFASRIDKAIEHCETAETYLKQRKIDVALREYYSAYTLIRSLQYPNEAKDNNGKMLVVTIPSMIEDILDKVEVAFDSRTEDNWVDLLFTYEGKPVTSIEFTYNTGTDLGYGKAKDGRGSVEVKSTHSGEVYHLNLEYEFRQLMQGDPEMKSIMNVVPKKIFSAAEKKVRGRKAGEQPASAEEKKSVKAVNAQQLNPQTSQLYAHPDSYKATMDVVLGAIKERRYSDIANFKYFTPDGLEVFNKLVFYGTGRVVGVPNVQFFNGLDSCVVARGLQMSFSFDRGRKQTFVEDVIFYFDREGKIDNMSFGLGMDATNSILKRNAASWDDYTREILLEFLENYKTAYALERLDFIEGIFSDNAQIIVGKVLKVKANSTYAERGQSIPLSGQNAIEYTHYTKKSYLEHLKRIFSKNEFININFSNVSLKKITKITDKNKFAIQLAQDYTSSTYSDKGYLFLLVDITNKEEPLIEIRTWQPNEIDLDNVFHEGMFYSN